MTAWKIGVIGGSGLYEIDGLTGLQNHIVETPWGKPSADIITGQIYGIEFVFLPRHGQGHALSPTDVPYRANIDALKRLGCTDVLSVSACGSLRGDYKPGEFVIVDQYIDRTFARPKSFFGKGCVAHVSMAHPVCERLGKLIGEASIMAGATTHYGGTYIAMEGPQFSSLAESKIYRQWGASVIGMTNMPEAKLAREAELPYATLAMVTDFDCWHEEEDDVSVTNVLEVLRGNADLARASLLQLAQTLSNTPRTPSPQGIENVLDYALITAPDARAPDLVKKLDAVAGRVL